MTAKENFNFENPEQMAGQLQARLQELKNARVKCGIVGCSGSGKSSLINAIAGKKIAETGVVETTMEAKDFAHKGIIFTDLPGCGTQTFPKDKYIEKFDILSYDCLILVTAERLTEGDAYLYDQLKKAGRLCFVVRSKFDNAIQSARRDHGHDDWKQTAELIRDKIFSELKSSPPSQIYFVSSWYPAEYDLAQLLEDIARCLSKFGHYKRERFIADMAIYSKEAIAEKIELAKKQVGLYSALAAVNAFNPIPGIDIAADIGILVKMGAEVAEIFGLTEDGFKFIKRLLGPNSIAPLVAKIAQFAARYTATEGVIVILKKFATSMATKEVAKYVPFLGQMVAAGIGWKATSMMGEQLVEDASGLASEILEAVICQAKTEGM